MSAGNIRVVLEVKDGEFHVKMMKAGKVVKQFGKELSNASKRVKKMERGINGFIPKIRDLFVTVSMAKGAIQNMHHALFGWQEMIISSNAEIERMTMLMQGLSSETKLAAKQLQAASDVKFVFDSAKQAPFEVKTLTDAFVKFRSVGVDPTNGSLQALSDAVASFGGNSHIMHRASVAIQQMAGKGVISMEELRQQLGEAVPNAMRVMAQSVGLSIKDLVNQISKGGVQSHEALTKMFKEFEMQMGGSAARMMTTFSGMSQRLVTEWELFKLSIGNAGYFDEVKGALKEIVDLMGSDRAKYFGRSIGEALTTGIIAAKQFVTFLAENWDWVTRVSKAILILAGGAVIGKLITAIVTFGARSVAVMSMAILNARTLSAAYVRANVSAMTLAGTSRALGAALAAAAGPIGIVISAVAALAYTFWDLNHAAENAAKSVIESSGAMATAAKMKAIGDEINHVNSQLILLQNRLTNTSGGKPLFGAARKDVEDMVSTLKFKLSELQDAMVYGNSQLAKDAIDKYTRTSRETLRAAAEESQAHYVKAVNDAHKKLTSGSLTKAGYFEIMSEETKRKFQTDLDSASAMAKKAESDMIASQDNKSSEAYRKAQAIFNAAADAKIELMKKLEQNLGQVGGLSGDGGAAKAAKAANTLLAQLERRLARIKAQNAGDGSTGFLAGIDKRLESIQTKGALAPKVIADIRDAAIGLDRESAIKKFNSGLTQMDVRLAKIKGTVDKTGSEDTFIAKLLSGKYGDVDFLTDQQVADFKAKAKELTFEEANAAAIKEALADNDKYVKARVAGAEKMQKAMDDAQKSMSAGLMTEHDQAIAIYNDEVTKYREHLANMTLSDEQRKAYLDQFYTWIETRGAKLSRDLETPMEKMARGWDDSVKAMQEASAGWMDTFSNDLADMVISGKADFQSLADSIIKDMVRISIQKALSGFMMSSGDFGGSDQVAGDAYMPAAQFGGGKFANGGIMTKFGRAQLNAYSGGGIANSPQVSLFGEGSRPEAYVPLPDGKTIPVSMKGGGQANVQVNVINQTGQSVEATQQSTKFDGEKMILDVVLKAAQSPGRFRDGLKGGLR